MQGKRENQEFYKVSCITGVIISSYSNSFSNGVKINYKKPQIIMIISHVLCINSYNITIVNCNYNFL